MTRESRITTKQLLMAVQNGIDNSEIAGFNWGDTVPNLSLQGRKAFEVRVRASAEEKNACGLPHDEESHYWWNTNTNCRRWEIHGGDHIRFVSSGDLGSSQFSALCYVAKMGGWWMLWPDTQHIIMRREVQSRESVKGLKTAISKVMITCRASRGPFKGSKHGRSMMEAHERMIKAHYSSKASITCSNRHRKFATQHQMNGNQHTCGHD